MSQGYRCYLLIMKAANPDCGLPFTFDAETRLDVIEWARFNRLRFVLVAAAQNQFTVERRDGIPLTDEDLNVFRGCVPATTDAEVLKETAELCRR